MRVFNRALVASLMAEKGITQAELCRLTGLSPQVVSAALTQDGRDPKGSTVTGMAVALGVCANDLYVEAECETQPAGGTPPQASQTAGDCGTPDEGVV
jgi:transcriptional regulator with XRE-family HTH domain